MRHSAESMVRASDCAAFATLAAVRPALAACGSSLAPRRCPNVPVARRACMRLPIRCVSNTADETTDTTSTTTPTTTTSEEEEEAGSSSSSSSSSSLLTISERERIEGVKELLEFWFSAVNLRRDWYLRRQMDDDGWLSPSVFLLFNRMKKLNATESDVIAAAQLSEELELSQPLSPSQAFGSDDILSQIRIRRSPDLPDFKQWDESELRCSFMLDSIAYDSTVDSIQAMFAPFANITYVRVYRRRVVGDETFAKSALICFDSQHAADSVFQQFASNAPDAAVGIIVRRRHLGPGVDGSVVYAANEQRAKDVADPDAKAHLCVLRVEGLPLDQDWRALQQLISDAVVERCSYRPVYVLFRRDTEQCYVTVADAPAVRDMVAILSRDGLHVAGQHCTLSQLNDEELSEYWVQAKQQQSRREKRREHQQALHDSNNNNNMLSSSTATYNNNNSTVITTMLDRKGVVVKMTGLPKGITWKDISTHVSTNAKIIFLNFERGSTQCFIRLASADVAAKLCQLYAGDEAPLFMGNCAVAVQVLDEQEEEEYWAGVEQRRKARQERERSVANQDESSEEQV